MKTVREHLELAEHYALEAAKYLSQNSPAISRGCAELANVHANIAGVGMQARWVDENEQFTTDPLYKDLHDEPRELLTSGG